MPDSRSRTHDTRKKVITCFTKSMGLAHCAAIHIVQKSFHEMEQESKNVITFMKNKIAGKDPWYIINIDQSPISYLFHSSKTIETKGTRTIHMCTSTTITKQGKLAVTIDASRKMLPPMLIFKGAPNGKNR
jgi:hypothetical protein